MRPELFAAMVLGVCILLAALLNSKSRREARERVSMEVNNICSKWAKTFDYVKAQQQKEIETKDAMIVGLMNQIEDLNKEIKLKDEILMSAKIVEPIRVVYDGTRTFKDDSVQ